MCKDSVKEVNSIRKLRSLIFLLTLAAGLICLAPRVSAATASSQAGIVAVSSGTLNVRSQASTSASVVTSLRKGNYITLISRSGSWWKVEYASGKYGYCHASYITVAQGSPATVATQSDRLNVRSGAGTSYAVTDKLNKGETVLRLSTSNGWSKVLYHGTKTGYVSAQYLSGSGGYAAVSLNVPNFKQTDSRWSGTVIGDSGKTISQIGCATTAIAMLESVRTGTTIYPDAMAKQLTYTPTGSVYWPSHYTAVTDSSGSLEAIYSKLKQGKPVLFGAQNAAGTQHWVVITGCTGGSSLTASAFSINDPGSNSRTSLQQLLDVYPAFYKYFYY